MESDRRIIEERETLLRRISGRKLEDMKSYVRALTELAGERATRDDRRESISLDLIARYKGEVTFVEVKVNEGHLTEYQKANLRIAKEHGFHTMVFHCTIDVQTSVDQADHSVAC